MNSLQLWYQDQSISHSAGLAIDYPQRRTGQVMGSPHATHPLIVRRAASQDRGNSNINSPGLFSGEIERIAPFAKQLA